jgi:hypothetical protein
MSVKMEEIEFILINLVLQYIILSIQYLNHQILIMKEQMSFLEDVIIGYKLHLQTIVNLYQLYPENGIFGKNRFYFFSSNVREFDLVVILVICGFYKTKFESPDFPEFRVYFSVSRKNFPLVPPLLFPPFLQKNSRRHNLLTKYRLFHKKPKSRPNKSRIWYFQVPKIPFSDYIPCKYRNI